MFLFISEIKFEVQFFSMAVIHMALMILHPEIFPIFTGTTFISNGSKEYFAIFI